MKLEYDDCLRPDGTTDRGWVRLAEPPDHPQWGELGERYREWVLMFEPGTMNVGNWLDYEHGPNYEPRGEAPTIHASAYLFRFCPNGYSTIGLGHGWFWEIDEAKEFIREKVAEYLSRQTVAI